jgi:DNA-binding SARP family transcriptional activator
VDAPFEEWTIVPRESYRLAYLDVLERLAGMALTRDDLDEVVLVAQRMLELDTCNESAHRLLIRAHLELGRTNEALRQYEQCRRVLRANLALNPSPATVALYREVRERCDETA